MALSVVVVVVMLTTCNSLPRKPNYSWDNDGRHPQTFPKRGPATYGDYINPPGEGPNPNWKELGQESIQEAVQRVRRMVELDHKAHNVILFMGDGLGMSTVTAARVYMAQSRSIVGKDAVLSWEKFPYTSLSMTYATDVLTPDSGNTGTAMLCGEKNRQSVICANQFVIAGNCSSLHGNELTSVLHHAIDNDIWTGVVTSARITHASPAVTYSHSAHRDWESDADLPDNVTCTDIASQLIDNELNKNIKVILGGGRYTMLPNGTADPEYPDDIDSMGTRLDGRNLIQEWQQQKKDMGLDENQFAYVNNLDEFNEVDDTNTEYLMGLFEPSHLQYESERTDEPSMADMVEKAINILKKGPNGYFLFVESGRIDHAHHGNLGFKALNETVALSDAVARAVELTNEDDTLIILTADHSHVFNIAGYPSRDSDIFGWDNGWNGQTGDDGKPYTTLQYANGPGFYFHRTANGSIETEQPRMDLTDHQHELGGINFLYDAAIPLTSETHAGEDVPLYARGPMAHLFHGTIEQSYIAHVINYALCIGENADLCENPPPRIGDCESGTNNVIQPSHVTWLMVAIVIIKYWTQKYC